MNYQERVSTRADVRALYEKVINAPAVEFYRGYTDTKSYGWDAALDDYCKEEGEHWFRNPSFDEHYVSEETSVSADAELLDEKLAKKEEELAALLREREELSVLIGTLRADVETARNAADVAAAERDAVRESWDALRRAISALRRAGEEPAKEEV